MPVLSDRNVICTGLGTFSTLGALFGLMFVVKKLGDLVPNYIEWLLLCAMAFLPIAVGVSISNYIEEQESELVQGWHP